MSDATAVAERREEIAGELTEWLHAAAREAQRQLLAAESTDDFVRLTESLCKLARGVRQCLGAHVKMEERRCADADEQAAREAKARKGRRDQRRRVIERAMTERLQDAFTDDDGDAYEDHIARLDERLDWLEEDEDFPDQDPDEIIAKLCHEFGFKPSAPLPAAAPIVAPTSPTAAAVAGGGPLAERSEERVVEGASPR